MGNLRRKPVLCPFGDRYKGGVNLILAFVWNVGTYDMDVKGEISSGSPTRIRVPMPCIGAE